MGIKLCFTDEELAPIKASERKTCRVCGRTATWKGPAVAPMGTTRGMETIEVCGWCALYSMKTMWGVEVREEILHVGRFCQLRAMKFGRVVPDLDERGRLGPQEAERYMLGIAFSSKVLSRLGALTLRGRGLDLESGNMSD